MEVSLAPLKEDFFNHFLVFLHGYSLLREVLETHPVGLDKWLDQLGEKVEDLVPAIVDLDGVIRHSFDDVLSFKVSQTLHEVF